MQAGFGAFILVFILILAGIRGCSNYRNSKAAEKAAAQDAVSMNVNSETSSEAADAVVMDPVSLTLSVVGDCTLGTDETFDYEYQPECLLRKLRVRLFPPEM